MVSKTVILIPHYNNLEGLKKSLRSIYHPKGIDVLVIDDGSNENNRLIVSNLKKELYPTTNLKVLSLAANKGIVDALNFGLDYILKIGTYEYVARIDCGDTCVENRFILQEDFLTENKEISLVGSWVRWMCKSSKRQVFSYRPPTESKKIKRRMSIRCNVIHPSVMYRVATVKEIGNYPHNYTDAEDYAYFFKIAKKSKIANIPKYLTNTEYNTDGISVRNKKSQNKSKLKVVMKYGRLDPYLLFGIVYNIALIYIPQKFIFRIKSHLR